MSGSAQLGRPASASLAALMLALLAGLASAAPDQNPATLCVLDFHRQGDDASADWLEQGLADMLITTMNRHSPYQVVERAHLQEILREHGLAKTGLIDTSTAVRQARLAKAELLVQGSFVRVADRLTIQVRLIRISNQQIYQQATWTGPYAKLLDAPRFLSDRLLAGLGTPVDATRLPSLEREYPRTIDVAESYYSGVRAFDAGRYPEALAHYLDAASHAGEFTRPHPAVLKMYYLLGDAEHAVVYASELAERYENTGDVPGALEYYFAAAEYAIDPMEEPETAIHLLERLLRLADRHEKKTGEIAEVKRSILRAIDELYQTEKYDSFGKVLATRDIRYQMWPGNIESELRRRAEEQARGGESVFENGKWVKRPVPRPSVLMWRIRARLTLARAYARADRIGPALDHYRRLLDEHEFLTRHRLYEGKHRDTIQTEAHFMLLRHHAETGLLIRDHELNRLNRLNVATDGRVFTRDFGDPSRDPRARVASHYEDRGYEYFDFASPPGHQIDSVTLRAKVGGIAAFAFNLPKPAGWPPQFSFSKRIEHFKFSKAGDYEHTVLLPPGTEFLSLGTSWGPGLYSNTLAEVLQYRLFGPKDGRDIIRWEVSFVVSPKLKLAARPTTDTATPLDPAIRKLIDRYAAGWDDASVVRDGTTASYAGDPRLDVYAEDWLVYSMDDDIRIFHQRDPTLTIGLPVTINTREREFDPSLVRTHDGRYALLWARGTSKRNARRFVAVSADLLRWERPRRMMFEAPRGDSGYTYSRSEPLERTYNIVPVRGGYAMLLAQGFMRYSEDLATWGEPRKVLPQDLLRNRLLKTSDGALWAIYENSSDELQPYTEEDQLHGYFVVDGQRYRHVTELRVSRSEDGKEWRPAGEIVVPGQPTGLWAFPLSEREIGIAAAFNNLFVRWFTASDVRPLRPIEADLSIMHQTREAECFARDGSLTCVRPIFDFEKQGAMLLATSSRALYERLTQ